MCILDKPVFFRICWTVVDRRTQGQINPKRKLYADPDGEMCSRIARAVGYGGNPEHKRNPGDFGLEPPSAHHKQPTKSLCDTVEIFERKTALRLLKKGARRGMFSRQFRGDFPQNIWSVTDQGEVLEAQLENRELGTYHGYPMEPTDPLAETILERWQAS